MMFPLRARLGSALVRLAAVVALLCWSGSASASCGDYLHLAGHSSEAKTPRDLPAIPPCANGECHRPTPYAPAPVPVAPSTDAPTDLLAGETACAPAATTSAPFDFDPPVFAVALADGIFHPPRR